jgi:hypothetical protein
MIKWHQLSDMLTIIMSSFHQYNIYTYGEVGISEYVLSVDHDFGKFLFTAYNTSEFLLFLSLVVLAVPIFSLHPVIRRNMF